MDASGILFHGRWRINPYRCVCVCGRFGVCQLTSRGVRKLRAIDDCARNQLNDSARVDCRIRMCSLTDLKGCARRFAEAFVWGPLVLIEADFKSAYRALPVKKWHLMFARVLLANPHRMASYTWRNSSQCLLERRVLYTHGTP